LVAAFTFAMVAPGGVWARAVAALLQGGAVLAALFRAQTGGRLLAVGLAATALTMAAAVVAGADTPIRGGLAALVAAGRLLLVPISVVLEFRRAPSITIESVTAALCVYLVLGMLFASLASATANIADAPYFAGQTSATSADYTYFSFIT